MRDRYRLRDPDEELGELEGLSFECHGHVEGPLVTNREGLLVATAEGRTILERAGLEIVASASAGEDKVFVFRASETVAAETSDDREDEDTNYGRLARCSSLGVNPREIKGVMAVDDTRLFAFDDALGAQLRAAGQREGLVDNPSSYAPSPENPWYIVVAARASRVAQFENLSCEGEASALPGWHPLMDFAPRPRGPGRDPMWSAPSSAKDLLKRLYASGAPLPSVVLQQAKPKASKKILDIAYSNYMIVSPSVLALVEELGIGGERSSVSFLDTSGAPMSAKGYCLYRAPDAPLVNWRSSDIHWTRSNTIWGFREIELMDPPLVDPPLLAHIPGTRLHFAHQRFVDLVNERGLTGFEFEPVSNYGYGYNLDDEFSDWQL